MEKFIDLHVHSTASDGTLTPSQLVSLAEEKNLKAFAPDGITIPQLGCRKLCRLLKVHLWR